MLYVHRKFEHREDDIYVFDIKFVITDDNVIEIKHVGIHAVNNDDLKLSPCVNGNPDIITAEMYDSAMKILMDEGVVKTI